MSALATLARQGSTAERAAIAAAAGTPPELLLFLAADQAPAVRSAVAANRATPPQAGLLLVEDGDAEVRRRLARRIGPLAPTGGGESRQARMVQAILARLVEDAEVEVRAALADAVAGLPDAPRALILRLARDTALSVAGPVLSLSPLLEEADLLALVAAPPAEFTRRLIARRPDLGEPVSEAVAASDDPAAIATLLANPSAAVREATLDRLAERSGAQPDWQAALVRRPALPPGAARTLSRLLACHLMDVLAARPDLPDGLAETLKVRIAERLEAATPTREAGEEAARSGNRPALVAALSEATGYSTQRLEAALALRSPRVIVALCWRAGWTAELAELVQARLGVPRAKILRSNVEGSWTLAPDELQWQIELLEEMPG